MDKEILATKRDPFQPIRILHMNWHEGFALLFLLGLWTWLHEHVLFGGRAFVMEDASRFFYPLWFYGSKIFHGGQIPLWNSDAGFGTPYLADPEMVCWYPPVRLLYLLFSPVSAFDCSILFHHLFALMGFWLFARCRSFSLGASTVGALLFGFATSVVCFTWDPVMLFSYSWIPWIFWASDRARKEARGSLLIFSISLAMQMASGYPLFAYLTFLALALEIAIQTKFSAWKIRFASLAGAFLMAVGFNLAWGIPFFELKGLSNLSARLGMNQSLPLDAMATWLNPFCFGQPLYSTGVVPYWLYSFFMGVPFLVLLGWALIKMKLKPVNAFMFLLFVLLSLGDTMKVGSWMWSYFPFYGWVVRSGYLLPLVFFFGARIGMESATHWFSSEGEKRKSEISRIFLLLLLFGLAYRLGTPLDLWPVWASLLFLGASSIESSWDYWSSARWVLLLLSIVFSLGPADQGINFTLEKTFYTENPASITELTSPSRIYHSPQVVDSFQSVSGANLRDIFQKMKQNLIPDESLAYGLEAVSYPNPIMMGSFLKWYLLTGSVSSYASDKLLDFLNVKYKIGGEASDFYRPLTVSGFSIPVYLNPNPLPKWFSVSQALSETDWKTDLNEKSIVNFHFDKECWVSNTELCGVYSLRKVTESFRTSNEVELSAEGNGRALLVSSETAYPGWRLQVRGHEKDMEEVNYGFRGAVLSQGEEKVNIVYHPVSFQVGCFMSLLVCSLWAFLTIQWGWLFKHA